MASEKNSNISDTPATANRIDFEKPFDDEIVKIEIEEMIIIWLLCERRQCCRKTVHGVDERFFRRFKNTISHKKSKNYKNQENAKEKKNRLKQLHWRVDFVAAVTHWMWKSWAQKKNALNWGEKWFAMKFHRWTRFEKLSEDFCIFVGSFAFFSFWVN